MNGDTLIGKIGVVLILIVAVYRMVDCLRQNPKRIILHVLGGGILFVGLNLLGFAIQLNWMNGAILILLGIPGIVLIVVLKLLWIII